MQLPAVESGKEADNDLMKIDEQISDMEKRIDSINTIIDAVATDEETGNGLDDRLAMLKEYEWENKINRNYIDTLKAKKRAQYTKILSRQENDIFGFRDSKLDLSYFAGYYDPDKAKTDEMLSIEHKKGIACNTGRGKMIYGFVNMHDRSEKSFIDFEKYSRIGVYSLFPEKYGNVEMIFSYNKIINNNDINNNLVKQAHKYNTKVDIVFSCYNWKKENKLKPELDKGIVILNIVDMLASIVEENRFDGVTIDFDIETMDFETVVLYSNFLLQLNNALKKIDEKKDLNVIISAMDVYDTAKYYTAGVSPDSLNKIKDKKQSSGIVKKYYRTKLETLLLPDLIDSLSLLMINMDFSFLITDKRYKSICPVYGKHDDGKSVGIDTCIRMVDSILEFDRSIEKVLCVVPLYGNIWKKVNADLVQEMTFMQKSFPEKEMNNFKDDFKLVMEDSSVFMDDLSHSTMINKFNLILDNKVAGIGIWNTDYADDSLLRDLNNIVSSTYIKSLNPHILVIRYGHLLRVLVGPNRLPIGIGILILISLYIMFIAYVKIDGKEKIVQKNRLIFIGTGLLLLLVSYIYIITIPMTVEDKFKTPVYLSIILGVVAAVGWYVYVNQKSKDLP